jgi:xanthine dehydrogenase accessory factor
METGFAFLKELCSQLVPGARLALVTVIARSGTGPREPGSKMIVLADGRTFGSIGGGDPETAARERARAVLSSGRPERLSSTSTCCGGDLDVLIEVLDDSSRAYFEAALAELDARRPVQLTVPHGAQASDMATGYFVDLLTPPDLLFVFGAGHIAERLVPVCARIGYRVVVVDDRPELCTRERFPAADEVAPVETFDNFFAGRTLDAGCAVVIATRDHGLDQFVLAQALRTAAGYVGMIGSARKRDAVFAALQKQGFNADDLKRVYCPVGLDIGAETPSEIAIAIAGELVASRRARRA